MLIISISAAAVALTLVVIAAFLIPTILEIKRTSKAARQLITSTEEELQPALKELRQVLMNVNDITDNASAGVRDVRSFMGALAETGKVLHAINGGINSVTGSFSKSSVWSTVAVTAGKFFLDIMKKKRRKPHGQ
jgi:uncharacterized protein YoxC